MQKTWGRYNQYNTDTAKLAFMAKVSICPTSGCWIWKGATANCKRYGSVGLAGKSYLAHRAAFLLFKEIDPLDLCVCHKCDNGFCVNPDHLFIGTQLDNVNDMEQKHRSKHPKGESHGRAKLSFVQVQSIRDKYSLGFSIRKLATEFNVARPTIARIVNNTGWTHHV